MTATTLRPELLCPAGTLKSMRYAFAYGAEALYAGQLAAKGLAAALLGNAGA